MHDASLINPDALSLDTLNPQIKSQSISENVGNSDFRQEQSSNSESLDFIEIDPLTYSRIYDNLCIARKNLENLSDSIFAQITSQETSKSKEYSEKLHYLLFLINNLLIANIGQLFPTSNAIIPSLQNFLIKETDPTLQQFSTKIMTISVMLSKCFSLISFNLPNNETIEKPKSLQFDQSPSEFDKTFSNIRPRTQSLPRTFFQKLLSSPQFKNLSDGLIKDDSYCSPEADIENIKTSESDELVLCRICEEYIKISEIEEHSKKCAVAYESSYKLITTDEKIVKLINAIQKNALTNSWPGDSDKTTNILLPMLHVIILLDAAVSENQNQITIETASRSLDQTHFDNSHEHNYVALLERAKELLHEKVKAFSHYSKLAKDGLLTLDKKTIQTTIADFEFIKPISSGAYARVYLARKKKTKDIYAIKVTPKSMLKQKNQVQRVLIEKNILLTNNNPYIVNFYYSFIGEHNIYLVMEFLPGGDLYSLLQNVGSLDEQSARTYAVQIIKALAYLHSNGIIHRDLKPDNVLITATGELKLTDFGLSLYGSVNRTSQIPDTKTSKLVNVESQVDLLSLQQSDGITPVGTPDYMAPEVLLTPEHTEAVDFWSLGALLFELVTGVPPFHSDTEEETFQRILKLDVDWSLLPVKTNDDEKENKKVDDENIPTPDSKEIPTKSIFRMIEVDDESDDSEDDEGFSPELVDFIKKLLVLDPNQRLRIEEIYAHPWFKGINWDDLNKSENFQAPFIPNVNEQNSTDTDYFAERTEFKQVTDADILEDAETAQQPSIDISRHSSIQSFIIDQGTDFEFDSFSCTNDDDSSLYQDATFIEGDTSSSFGIPLSDYQLSKSKSKMCINMLDRNFSTHRRNSLYPHISFAGSSTSSTVQEEITSDNITLSGYNDDYFDDDDDLQMFPSVCLPTLKKSTIDNALKMKRKDRSPPVFKNMQIPTCSSTNNLRFLSNRA